MKRRLAFGLLFAFWAGLTGCPASAPPAVQPSSPVPSTLPAQSAAFVYPSGKALERGTLTVRFKTPSGDATGVRASLLGPTLGTGDTGVNSVLTFGPLAPGNYRLLATSSSLAWGQAENVAVAYSNGAVDLNKKNVELTVTLVPGAKVTGKVMGPSGPLWGARVRAGLATTTTNGDGSFTLEGVTPGAVTVSVGKTLYEGATRATEVSAGGTRDLGNISLASKPGPTSYYLYNPNDLIEGKSVRVAFSQLFSRLNAAGFSEGGSEARIWFLVNPALTEQQCQEIQSFVQSGGKVIFLGEWGGYAGARPDDANRLLNRFGLGLNADLVRSTSNLGRLEWILVRDFNFPRPQSVEAVALFASSSTYGVPPAWSIASAGTSGYRVMSGGVSVASAAQEGEGLVVALGDASAWADFASASGGNYNLAQHYNWNFMLNLFQW